MAQNRTSVVYLKDGSSLQGKIINETPEKLTLKKGRFNQLISVDEIEKVVPWKKVPATSCKNSMSLAVNSLFNSKLALNYERRMFTKKISIGGGVNVNWPHWIQDADEHYSGGVEISPTFRYYIYGEANSYGFYTQAKIYIGYFWAPETVDTERLLKEYPVSSYEYDKNSFFAAGYGIQLGYLFNLGKHWGIDVSLGFKEMSEDKTILNTFREEENKETHEIVEIPYETDSFNNIASGMFASPMYGILWGLASPLDFKLSIVYKF